MRMVAPRSLVVRASCAVLLAAVVLAAPAVARAIPYETFHQRVDAAMAILSSLYFEGEDGASETSAPTEEQLAEVRALLPPRETVEMADGTIEVDNSWLTSDLEALEATTDPETRTTILDRITTRLNGLDTHLVELDEATARDDAAERQQLTEILQRAEFRDPADNPVSKFMRELRERIMELLTELLQTLFGGARGATFESGLRAVILAAGAVALFLLARSIAQAIGRRKRAEKKKREKRTVLGEELDETTTAADLATAARELAARGEYRDAVRKLFVALLYQLDERKIVRLQAEATNREYLALVRRVSRLHPPMAAMAETFDRVWYGREPIDRERYEAYERHHAEARRIVDGSV